MKHGTGSARWSPFAESSLDVIFSYLETKCVRWHFSGRLWLWLQVVPEGRASPWKATQLLTTPKEKPFIIILYHCQKNKKLVFYRQLWNVFCIRALTLALHFFKSRLYKINGNSRHFLLSCVLCQVGLHSFCIFLINVIKLVTRKEITDGWFKRAYCRF